MRSFVNPNEALLNIFRLPQLNERVSDCRSRDLGSFAGPTEAVDTIENERV